MAKMKESLQHGDELRCSEIQKAKLAEFGIHTREQLIEAFNEPFNISMFVTPVKNQEAEDQSA